MRILEHLLNLHLHSSGQSSTHATPVHNPPPHGLDHSCLVGQSLEQELCKCLKQHDSQSAMHGLQSPPSPNWASFSPLQRSMLSTPPTQPEDSPNQLSQSSSTSKTHEHQANHQPLPSSACEPSQFSTQCPVLPPMWHISPSYYKLHCQTPITLQPLQPSQMFLQPWQVLHLMYQFGCEYFFTCASCSFKCIPVFTSCTSEPFLQQNVFPAPLNMSSQAPAPHAPVPSQEHSLPPPVASYSFVTAPHVTNPAAQPVSVDSF